MCASNAFIKKLQKQPPRPQGHDMSGAKKRKKEAEQARIKEIMAVPVKLSQLTSTGLWRHLRIEWKKE